MSNSLTVLIPVIVASLQRVLRQTGFVFNGVTLDASNAAGALNQTINLPASAALTPYTVSPGATPPALTDVTPTTKTLVLDQYRAARFHLTGEDYKAIGVRGPDFRSAQMDEAIAALMHEAAAFVWGIAEAGCGRALGAQGTDPFASNPNILMDAWKLLADAKAPMMGRVGILSPTEYAAAGKLAQFQKLNEAPQGTNFATASLGMLANFRVGMDQAIGTHAVGTQDGAYAVNANTAAGQSVVVLKTGTGTMVAGDVVNFGAGTQKYVVKSLVGMNLTLQTPLVAAVSANDAVTVAAAHRANLLIHPDAIAVGMRAPAEAPDGDAADMAQVIADPVTGIALRIAHYKGYHAGQWEASIIYGAASRRPDLGVKLIA